MDELEELINQLRASTLQITEERANANALFLSIGDGSIATDHEGKIQRINDVALGLLGYTREEVMGEWFPKVIVAQDERGKPVSALNRPITRAILGGKPVTERMNYITKSGTVLPVSVTVSPIILNGRPIGAVEVFRDISKDNEIDRMKSEFISIASHQLRTPLTSVKTYAHLLAAGYQGKLTRDQRKFMTIILNSVERMSDLIDILLDVSRIEAGKIEVILKPTDIKELIRKILKELEPQAAAKHITLSFKAPQRRLYGEIDQVLTTEIITNLLSNSIKYTPARGKAGISIDHDDKNLLLTVSDSGYGIPLSDQTRIFSKFFRSDNITQREPSGSGLGLYLVKKIVETMHGKIRFESIPEQGTTFFVELPVTLTTKKPLAKITDKK